MRGDPGGVTVVIPTHNRRELVPEAVASALRSRCTVSVIVVDDGSRDGTAEILAGLGDRRLEVVRVEPAGGGSAARNIGLARCRTGLVMFLDDDDVLRPGALDRLAEALVRHRAAAGAAGAYRRFGAGADPSRPLHPRWPTVRPVWRELLFGWNMPPASLLWRADVVRAIGGWNEQYRSSEDRDLSLRAYPRPFALVPATVMDYRVHANQVTGQDRWAEHQARLREFATGLPGADAEAGRRILDLAARIRDALGSYREGDFHPAASAFAAAVAPDLGLVRSPVVGPWLLSMAARSAVLARLPQGSAERVLRAARRWRVR